MRPNSYRQKEVPSPALKFSQDWESWGLQVSSPAQVNMLVKSLRDHATVC